MLHRIQSLQSVVHRKRLTCVNALVATHRAVLHVYAFCRALEFSVTIHNCSYLSHLVRSIIAIAEWFI